MFRNLTKWEWVFLIAFAIVTFILISAYPSHIVDRDYFRIVGRAVSIGLCLSAMVGILRRSNKRGEVK